jgi:16S rRNA (guanine966-N2)-methyltransferase
MTRVVAGAAGGRRLAVPPGHGTRPTSDRAREGLFSSLLSLLGPLEGQRVIDLYAGSGAVGLEALSRGATHVCLVEADPRAARVARDNVRTLGLPGADVLTTKVETLVAAPPEGQGYDIAFLDPPYALDDGGVHAVLAALAEHGWLRAGAVVVVERASRGQDLSWPAGYEQVRFRRYGEATLWYGRAAEPAATGRDPGVG